MHLWFLAWTLFETLDLWFPHHLIHRQVSELLWKTHFKLRFFKVTKTWSLICSFLFSMSFQANGEAALGKYVAGSAAGAAGDAALFVANHAY